MNVSGEVEVLIQKPGREPENIGTGTLANGGCLSLKFPLQPAPGETILLRKVRSTNQTPDFKVEGFSAKSGGCKNNHKPHHYVYHLNLKILSTG